MAIPRKQQINLTNTSYYHCISRCVRRAFLYGEDPVTGRSYSHRKQWVIEQLRALCDNFAITVCTYAVMTNHYHVVLHVQPEKVKQWSDAEIILRCKKINSLRMHGFVKPKLLEKSQYQEFTEEQISAYRNKLTDISSFMGALNEYLARRANKEDECKGHFWEERFKSMALLDETAVLTCMAYVDLNPIRAGIATSLEDSDFTSIQERIFSFQKKPAIPNSLPSLGLQEHLGTFQSASNQKANIPCSWERYLELVTWTAQHIHTHKKEYWSPHILSLLSQLSISPQMWISNATQLEKKYSWIVGSYEKIKHVMKKNGLRWVRGIRSNAVFVLKDLKIPQY